MSRLDVRRACELEERAAAQRWLIEGLWAESAVGIVGGEPKCCKSFLGLCMAVSVAAGVPCLGRYPVATPGPVLLFAAEDAPHIVRTRLQGICAAAHVPWDSLDIHVIVDPVVRLDVPADRARLRAEVERLRPRLVVLDPFVRLHRIDENAAAEVARLLAYLRVLQGRPRGGQAALRPLRPRSVGRCLQAAAANEPPREPGHPTTRLKSSHPRRCVTGSSLGFGPTLGHPDHS